MTKYEFIDLVSKINETEEDEFKAEYNSPELLWDKVISKMTGTNCVQCHCNEQFHLFGSGKFECLKCKVEL